MLSLEGGFFSNPSVSGSLEADRGGRETPGSYWKAAVHGVWINPMERTAHLF